MSSHYHACDACDGWFVREAPELPDRCSVEPERCPRCVERENEAAYERSLEQHYGGSTPTLRERVSMDAMNRTRR